MLAAPLPSPSAQSTRSLCVGPDWRLSLGGTCAAQRPAVRCARPAGRPARGGVCWAPFSGWPRSAACPGVTPRRDQERGSAPPPPLPGRSGLERALLGRACAFVLVYSRALATSYACALLPACLWPTTICLARCSIVSACPPIGPVPTDTTARARSSQRGRKPASAPLAGYARAGYTPTFFERQTETTTQDTQGRRERGGERIAPVREAAPLPRREQATAAARRARTSDGGHRTRVCACAATQPALLSLLVLQAQLRKGGGRAAARRAGPVRHRRQLSSSVALVSTWLPLASAAGSRER